MKNRKLLGVVILIAVTIIVAISYVAFRPKDEATNSRESAGQSAKDLQNPNIDPRPRSSSPDTPVSSAGDTAGEYVNYSEARFAAASNARRVIFFHAPWCPQCRALEKSIKTGTIPAGWVILKTDYDTSGTLKQKYGVTLQTTMVEVDSSGNLKQKVVAYDEPSLQAIVKALGE